MTQGSDDNFHTRRHMDDELVPFDARDYSGRRAMWMLMIAVVLLLGAAFALFQLYQKGVRDRTEPPKIEAHDAPFKVELENPGGEETPNQDKTVYDVMNGTAKTEDVVPAPQAETPVDLPKSATIVVNPPSGQSTSQSASDPASDAPNTQPSPVPAISSQFVVQVASVRSQASAETLWTQISGRFQSVLPAGSRANIKRVNLNEKGIYYRLRVDGLADKAAADRLCDQLTAQNQACFVTRR